MKKGFRILIVFIQILCVGLFISCEMPAPTPTEKITMKLETPQNARVVVDKQTETTIFYFDAVENASKYVAYLYIEGKPKPIDISSVLYTDVVVCDLTNFEGILKVTVLAVGSTTETHVYLDSDLTELIEFNTDVADTYTSEGGTIVPPKPDPDPDPEPDPDPDPEPDPDPDPSVEDTSVLTGYYQNANSLTGTVLEKTLRSIISNTKHTTTYDELKRYLCYADADPNNSNNMILFYSRASVPAKYDSSLWNREHVWPKSKGNYFGNSLAGADIHHIRPTIIDLNSKRGSLKLGNISGSKTELYYLGKGTGCYTGGGYFEPSDEIKGDVARIIFYVSLRYGYSITSSGVADLGDLLEWNAMDPVSVEEKIRNEYAYSIQGNRNPFIDHSFLADFIW